MSLVETKPLWEILVPCQWNDGNPVRTRHHKAWDEKVRRVAGGLTVLKPGTGTWTHEGAVYSERVIPVRIFCTEDHIRQIAQITIEHYEQHAVMYHMITASASIVHASNHQKERFRKGDSVAEAV